jgi:hypothetical protein
VTRSLVLSFLVACAPNIAPDLEPDATPIDGSFPIGPFATLRGADGTSVTRVDATALDTWTYGDFESGAAIDEAGPWDLRFQRFHLSTNGGISGTGGVEVAALPGVRFSDIVAVPPSAVFVADLPDGDDTNAEPDYVFEQGDGWYDYDPGSHVLTPKPMTWLVRTAGGTSTIKLAIDSYYDDAGTAGVFTLHWGLVP